MKKQLISLTPIETTAYWWINIIKSKVEELLEYGVSFSEEKKFLKIFLNYNEENYRNLYLELINFISIDVQNYVLKGITNDVDMFSQDTDYEGHNRLNEELSTILGVKVPDIRLAFSDVKDSVIYTSKMEVKVWYKSCGVMKLSTLMKMIIF